MPDESWTVRTGGTDSGQWDGGAALAWDCPFAIVNESSADLIEVRDLYVEMAHGLDSAFGYLGQIQLQKITALVGGVAEVPAKHLGSVADLPAEVKIVKNPESVTTNGVLRRFLPMGMMRGWFATTFNFPRFGGYGVSDEAVPFGTVFKRRGSVTQPIVLREGEGVALYCPGPGNLVDMRAGCQINVQATGASHSCPIGFSPRGPGRASAAIFNGPGSGVVLDVLFLQVTEEVESSISFPPKCRVVVGPMKVLEAEEMTAQPYSGGNQALDAGVKLYKNGFLRLDQFRTENWWLPQWIYETATQGAQFKMAWAHQRMRARVIESRTPTAAFPFPKWHLLDRTGPQATKTGLVLRQGEGVAVCWGTDGGLAGALPVLTDVFPTGFQNMDFVAQFTRKNAPPAAGGNTYSRSRVVNA